ncbi:MAG TPA: lipocalin family protein [Bacteroidales bacterium]|nr:lipocalin family protein [Bacteroidales bacterium]
MNKNKILSIAGIAFAVLALFFILQPSMAQRPYITDLNLDRYLGVWYETARFPHSFEKGLVGVTATYSLRTDGKIKVENAGFSGTLDGERSLALGKAKLAGKATDGHLKVSFFLFFYADYFIMDLDPDYQWALIGSKSDKYLWILSRTPQMDDITYNMILDKARGLGYDLKLLYKVPQKPIQ